MAGRAVSPGASLLRASRMFAVPPPLPKPTADLASSTTFFSNTATQPHPTNLTITTPPSSLSKGDWGLKRPLPLRSTTKTSTPLIRFEKMDTMEHVTEFASAADHTLTLQKWQELNLPLSEPPIKDSFASGRTRRPGRGVFEEDANAEGAAATDEHRWKFSGPWLAGQTEGEFNFYLQRQVRRRKAQFQEYLRQVKAHEDTKDAQRKAAEQGEEAPAPVKASEITPEQMTQYLRELRQDRSVLFRHVRKFLDLPPSPAPKTGLDETVEDLENLLEGNATGPFGSRPYELNASEQLPTSNSPYAENGPPKTHPSAGLSYLRTGNHIFNHPVFGPQAHKPPVQGRVVMPKNAPVGSFAPKLGVAGVVTDVPSGHDSFRTSNVGRRRGNLLQSIPGLVNIEPDKVGGSKVYLEPSTASIDPKGRIILEVKVAQPAAVAVHEGTVNDTPATLHTMPRIRPLSRPRASQGYGLTDNASGGADNAEDTRRQNPRADTKPVDERTAVASLQALLDEN
ncbi:MAG: hypothetical protein M1818_007077 [Claussenomyces sp. TS43310]|nr:MAG: hypothetical protein M1818_007077 [Claussenomyces sp. TS43310]